MNLKKIVIGLIALGIAAAVSLTLWSISPWVFAGVVIAAGAYLYFTKPKWVTEFWEQKEYKE